YTKNIATGAPFPGTDTLLLSPYSRFLAPAVIFSRSLEPLCDQIRLAMQGRKAYFSRRGQMRTGSITRLLDHSGLSAHVSDGILMIAGPKNSSRKIAPSITSCRAKTFAGISRQRFAQRSRNLVESTFSAIARDDLQRHVGCFPDLEFAYGRETGRHRHSLEERAIRQTHGPALARPRRLLRSTQAYQQGI
ncbi:MAG: hypothetical protein ABSC92_11755, partial [Rhizomicrobium sp.]